MPLNLSVVIRTRNLEEKLFELLEKLTTQTILPSEVILVNNFSTERELKYFKNKLSTSNSVLNKLHAKKIKVKMVTLTDEEFSHPYSTNLGVWAAENELVCITNAHSIPTSNRWLEHGLENFNDPKVAGISGFFFPHNCNIGIGTLYYLIEKIALTLNDPASRFTTINCIIKKSLWEEYPFDEKLPKIVPETKRYGLEDYDWSKEMAARGFKIIIDPKFSVYHSHEKGPKEIYRNIKNYILFTKTQIKIGKLKRPRKSHSKVQILNRKIHFF